MGQAELQAVIRSVRPVLQEANLTEDERAKFLYSLVREVHAHVKYDVYAPGVESIELARIGKIVNAALPPATWPDE